MKNPLQKIIKGVLREEGRVGFDIKGVMPPDEIIK